MAKIEELLPNSDGVVRSARVRVNGEGGKQITFRRPIQHLIPLEVRATTKEENVRDRSREEEDVRDISCTDQPNAEKLRNNQLQRTRRKAAIHEKRQEDYLSRDEHVK